MKRHHILLIFVGCVCITSLIFGEAYQAPQTQNPSTLPKGPLGMIFGPVGEVGRMDVGAPKAPMTDTIYLDLPPEEWPPDEFIANPDREFDWHDLKGWHY